MAFVKTGLKILAAGVLLAGGYVAVSPSCSSDTPGHRLSDAAGPGDQNKPGSPRDSGEPENLENSGNSGGDSGGLPPEPEPLTESLDLTLNGQVFRLELALNHAQRYQGLSDRRSIGEDRGMLFVHRSAQVLQFVMRRCHVPIDLIYLDEHGRIVAMHAMPVVQPIGGNRWYDPRTSYSSHKYAQFAIELRGGTLPTLGLQVGDIIDLPLEALKARAR